MHQGWNQQEKTMLIYLMGKNVWQDKKEYQMVLGQSRE